MLQWVAVNRSGLLPWLASSSTDYQGPMPMDVDRVPDAKGQGKRKERKVVINKGKGNGKAQKGKGCNMLHLWKARASC